MKLLLFLLLTASFFSCTRSTNNLSNLQHRIDSLESKLADTYTPGLGEFMSSIQVHHNKLWFSGQQQNWKLADFEIHEIRESIGAIEKYQTEREESKLTGMIKPALDSVDNAIRQKNPVLFNSSYTLLTRTCNNCHQATQFEFNVVKIPVTPPFSNQDFTKPR
jgi:hypothetical protein